MGTELMLADSVCRIPRASFGFRLVRDSPQALARARPSRALARIRNFRAFASKLRKTARGGAA